MALGLAVEEIYRNYYLASGASCHWRSLLYSKSHLAAHHNVSEKITAYILRSYILHLKYLNLESLSCCGL